MKGLLDTLSLLCNLVLVFVSAFSDSTQRFETRSGPRSPYRSQITPMMPQRVGSRWRYESEDEFWSKAEEVTSRFGFTLTMFGRFLSRLTSYR